LGGILLLEDLFPDVLSLLDQVLDVFVDLGLVLVLETFEDISGIVSSFFVFLIGVVTSSQTDNR
jgi:uncharacterized protein involved in cysteine biosynthesis